MLIDSWWTPVCVPETLECFSVAPLPSPALAYVGGTPPFGYSIDAGTLRPNEGERAVIADAIKMRAGGMSLRGISAALAFAGNLSRTGVPFAPAQVLRMIKGPGPRRKTQRRHAIANGVRRAVGYGVVMERVDPVVVFERDHWRCCICGRATPRSGMGNPSAGDAPTLDHIVPMSRGGPHTYANVRCACHACNSGKRQPRPVRA